MAEGVYVAVTNIPSNFHAADLRGHFSSFVEKKSFICFHFRHRPELSPNSSEKNEHTTGSTLLESEESSEVHPHYYKNKKLRGKRSQIGTKCCVIIVMKSCHEEFINKYNEQQWTDVNGQYLSDLCELSLISLRNNAYSENVNSLPNQNGVDEKDLLSMPELRPPDMMPNGNVGTPTLVFLDFIQKCLLPNSIVNKLQLKFPSTSAKRLYSNVNFEYENSKDILQKQRTKESRVVPDLQTQCSPLLKSKRFVPVETSSTLCSSIINQSEPTKSDKTIEKSDNVNENLPGESSVVNISHKGAVTETSSSKSDIITPSLASSMNTIDSNIFKTPATCRENPDNFAHPFTGKQPLTGRERKRMERQERRKTRALMDEGIEEHLIRIDKRYHNDDDAEEWDRHEASEDDPSNQERNKERLYEEEIEQPWEKGGPGVVFYTDAMYWQAKEGDFDEQTTDDLDVDFSPYEGNGPGDKDIQDFLKIRKEKRFREGYDNTDRFSIGLSKKPVSRDHTSSTHFNKRPFIVGQFECHTKGIGRKLMEKQGWHEGQGLGVSGSGIKEALKGDGQKPQSKKGLGYIESEPVIYGPSVLKKAKVQRSTVPHLITTIKDDPQITDPKEPLLQRNEPTCLKHRQSFFR